MDRLQTFLSLGAGAIFKNAPIGIALENLEGQLQLVNPALCNFLGYKEEELQGMSCRQLSYPDDLPNEEILFNRLMASQILRYQMEKRFLRKDGGIAWGLITVALLDLQKEPSLIFGTVEDITERKVTAERLRLSEAQLQHLAGSLIRAQDEERGRISRELHDDIAQRAALLSLEIDSFRNDLDDAEWNRHRSKLLDLHRASNELAAEIHKLSHELHSSKLQFLGLRAALKDLCEKIAARQQIEISLHAAVGADQINSETAFCLFRVTQEALNNVAKHSQASQATVEVTVSTARIVLSVKDSGIGFAPSSSSGGIGLSTMRERLRAVGGDLKIISGPGMGTEIVAEVLNDRAGHMS